MMEDQRGGLNLDGKRNQPDEITSQPENKQNKKQRFTSSESPETNSISIDDRNGSGDISDENHQALQPSVKDDFDDDDDDDDDDGSDSVNREELMKEFEELKQSQNDFLVPTGMSKGNYDLKKPTPDEQAKIHNGTENDMEDKGHVVEQIPDEIVIINDETNNDMEDIGDVVKQSDLNRTNKVYDPLTRKMSLYNPRKWYEYCNCPEIKFAIARVAVCQDTKMMVNKNENAMHGDIWQLMKKRSVSIKGVPWLPDETDSDEFLQGCFRLGSCISAERLSVLLGGGYRSPEYCEYLLTSIMGVLKSVWKKSKGIDQNITGQGDTHLEVDVNGDGWYNDDDELADPEKSIQDQDQDQTSNKDTTTVTDECDVETDEEEKGEGGIENNEDDTPSKVRRKRKSFQKGTSYVLRNFLSTIAGKDIPSLRDFQQHCENLDIKFVETITKGLYEHPLERLKWLSEKFLAPELGEGRTMSTDPLVLWRNAEKNYSTKTMSRCALIQHDKLMNWLNYASEETSGQRLTMDHLTPHTPVVAIAPIAMLYLADKAANFALKILTKAKVIAPKIQPIKESDQMCWIEHDEIWNGYRYLISSDKDVTTELHMYSEDPRPNGPKCFTPTYPWPTIKTRPMTESADILLCESPPASSISIPKDVMEEMRSVVKVYSSTCNRLMHGFRNRSRNGHDQNIGTKKMNKRNELDIIEDRRNAPNYKETTRDKLLHFLEKHTIAEELIDIKRLVSRGNVTDPKILELHKKVFEPKEPEPEPEDSYKSDLMWNSSLSVDARRLAWICLRALGKVTETDAVDANHALGYGSTVNYTSFGELAKDGLKGNITSNGLALLTSLTDSFVRHEAEILMACAQHDDGRPWIDRADVVLVNSVRKEPFLYKDNL